MTNKEAIETIQIIQKAFIGEKAKNALDMAVTLLKEDTIEVWRDAEWPRDAANPMKKDRFKDYELNEWVEGALLGQAYDGWIDANRYTWKFCQVRDE
jgi:hypothetical protein